MTNTVSFNLELARVFVKEHKIDNGLNVKFVLDALNSIHSRNEYLKYFYDLFLQNSTKKMLVFDRLDFRDLNSISTRHKYEASGFAFLSNLHEMMDSYPFLYLGIFQEAIDDPKYLNWRKLQTYQSNPVVQKIFELKGSEEFIKLEDINNIRKHRALPRVANKYSYLEVSTTQGSEEQYQDLKNLMSELHDYLLPKYIEILNMTFSEA